MKIVHVISSLRNAGAEAVLYRLILCNTENSHSVICLSSGDYYEPLLREAGVDVHLLEMRASNALPALWKLYKTLRREKPDVIQSWMFHANFLAGIFGRLSGCRAVVWGIHQSNPKLAGLKKTTYAVHKLCVMLSRFLPAKIVSCGHRAMSNHLNEGYAASKMITVCNGYNVSEFVFDEKPRESLRNQWAVGADTVLFGNVARWHPVKDHPTLLRGLKEINTQLPWRVALAGAGMNEHNTTLMELINELDLADHCILLDQIDDVRGFMSALDVHMLSSSDEGFPNVLCEAMSCGVPCITTDCGDAGFIVGDTGWVSPIRDPAAYARNIELALLERTDLSKWEARKHRATQRIADNFSVETMSSQYNAVWCEASRFAAASSTS